MKLTQEEKRIKIAKEHGFSVVFNEDKQLFELLNQEGKWVYPYDADGDSEEHCWSYCPDYFNDLNAMHAAWEKVIKGSDELEDKYSIELLRAVGSDDPSDGVRPNGSDATWALASNAPSQARFEALGLTLNLWTSEE